MCVPAAAGVSGRWLAGEQQSLVSSVEEGYVAIENGRREEVDNTTVINDTTATLLPTFAIES